MPNVVRSHRNPSIFASFFNFVSLFFCERRQILFSLSRFGRPRAPKTRRIDSSGLFGRPFRFRGVPKVVLFRPVDCFFGKLCSDRHRGHLQASTWSLFLFILYEILCALAAPWPRFRFICHASMAFNTPFLKIPYLFFNASMASAFRAFAFHNQFRRNLEIILLFNPGI